MAMSLGMSPLSLTLTAQRAVAYLSCGVAVVEVKLLSYSAIPVLRVKRLRPQFIW